MTLLADVNRPGSQEDVVSNWEPAHSLVEDAGPWGRDCPFPALVAARLPLYLQQGMSQSTACQLSSGIHSVLCSVSGPSSALG